MKKYLISVYYSTMLLFGKKPDKSGNLPTTITFFMGFLFFWNTIYGWARGIINKGAKITDSFDTLILFCFVLLFVKLVLFRKEKYFELLQNEEDTTIKISKKKALFFYLGVLAFFISFFIISYHLRDSILA
jgi:hypothetical protein